MFTFIFAIVLGLGIGMFSVGWLLRGAWENYQEHKFWYHRRKK